MRIIDWSSDVCSSDLTDFALAFAKSQLGAGVELPREGTVFVSVRDEDKTRVLPAIHILTELGFKVLATGGTQRFLAEQGIAATKINKVLEGRPHIEDAIRNRQVHLVINPTDGHKEIGRASGRERVCPSVSISVVVERVKKKITTKKSKQ